MADHYGMLRDYRFSDDVDDIRGAALYGVDDDKLGKIDDVIFDHATGTIQYAVVDTGGWLSSKKFLVPADRIRPYGKNDDDFSINATKQQIEQLPKYDEKATTTDAQWAEQDTHQREAWGSGPVMHKEGSTHSITPEASEMPAGRGSGVDDQAYMPDRLVNKFTSAAPDPSKIRMRPSGLAAKAEDSRLPGEFQAQEIPTLAAEEAEDRAANNPVEAQRDHLTNPSDVYGSERERARRWSAFEDHLRKNRVDVTASCHSCGTARDRVA
ncbi:MAG TPA: PRC-barrel domain-containing protein [Terriglobales bacterium]